jgi:hypothetical protein
MKLADRTVEIHSRGIENSNQFTIAQTSKMFKILSDSLYSDKVMAVIRELSTNAYDAHIAAGNKNPFKVILPTRANPSFTVRDYGTGLSQKDMEELYTTYGASNKNDSNDFVGCLGLGSKSPFAYTKSFGTASYYNGTKYSYIAAMDEAGVPSLNLFDISPTTEPNGLEINFAVKQYDFDEFTTKSKRIFHYFKMRPIIEGGTDTTLNDHSYSHNNVVIEGKGWKIGRVSQHNHQYPSHYNSPGSGVVAIMGNIAYPVDTSKIIGEENEKTDNESIQRWNRAFKKVDVDNWKNLVKEILNAGLYLEIQFGIGELEMDVSREGLQYTKNVIKVLRERTLEIYMQLKDDMSTKISECKSLTEAYTTYYNLSDLAGGWTAGAVWVDPSGKSHELNSGKDLEYKFKKNKQLYVFNWRSAGYRSRRLVYLTDKIHWETLSGRGAYYYDSSTKKSGKMVYFRCDVKGIETAKKILTKYCNQNDCFAYLMVDSDHPEDSTKGFDDMIKDIGGESNLLNVSDYKSLLNGSTNRTSRGSSGTISKQDVFIINGLGSDKKCETLSGNGMNDSCYLRELSDDLMEYLEDTSNEIVYVPILRYGSIENYPSMRNIYAMSDNKDLIVGQKLFDNQKIFAIKSSVVQKLKDEGLNLVDFNEWFKKWATKIVSKLHEKVSSYSKIMKYSTDQYNTADNTYSGNEYYYTGKHSDRNIMFHIINLFGIDYRKYISNKDLCDIIDQWFLIEFFAYTIHHGHHLKKIKKEDYYSHMAVILNNYGINGIDPSSIRDANMSLVNIKQQIAVLYNGDKDNIIVKSLEKNDSDNAIVDSLPKMADIRKNLKDGVDKSPMFKYIVGSNHDADFGKISSNNPLKIFDTDGYYSKPAWFSSMTSENNIESLKTTIGNLI